MSDKSEERVVRYPLLKELLEEDDAYYPPRLFTMGLITEARAQIVLAGDSQELSNRYSRVSSAWVEFLATHDRGESLPELSEFIEAGEALVSALSHAATRGTKLASSPERPAKLAATFEELANLWGSLSPTQKRMLNHSIIKTELHEISTSESFGFYEASVSLYELVAELLFNPTSEGFARYFEQHALAVSLILWDEPRDELAWRQQLELKRNALEASLILEELAP